MLFAIPKFGQCPKCLGIPRSGYFMLLQEQRIISDNAQINLRIPQSGHFDVLRCSVADLKLKVLCGF